MKLDKKQLPQIIIVGVLALVLVTIGFISFTSSSPGKTPPPAPLKESPKVSRTSTSQAAAGIVDVTQTVSLAGVMPTLVRRDPFAQQYIPGDGGDEATTHPKPAPVRTPAVVTTEKVPALNPFSQGTGYSTQPAAVSTRAAEEDKDPEFVLTGVVRGSENVAIIRVGDKGRHIVKQGQMIDGSYRLLSVTDSGAVLVHNNRRIHVKIGGVKNAS